MQDEPSRPKPSSDPLRPAPGPSSAARLRGGLAALFGASVAACTAAAVVGARVWHKRREEQEAEWRRRAESAAPAREATSTGASVADTARNATESPSLDADPERRERASGASVVDPATTESSDEPATETKRGPAARVFHLRPATDGWELAPDEGDSLHFATKKAALEVARQTAREAEPSQLVVHRLDGSVQHRYSYGDVVE